MREEQDVHHLIVLWPRHQLVDLLPPLLLCLLDQVGSRLSHDGIQRMVLGYRVDSEPLELHFNAPLREPHVRPRMLDHVSHLVWLVAAPCVVMVSGPTVHYVLPIALDVHPLSITISCILM